MTDLSVAVDYDRYGNSREHRNLLLVAVLFMDSDLGDSLTIGRGRSSGRAFLNKMLL